MPHTFRQGGIVAYFKIVLSEVSVLLIMLVFSSAALVIAIKSLYGVVELLRS